MYLDKIAVGHSYLGIDGRPWHVTNLSGQKVTAETSGSRPGIGKVSVEMSLGRFRSMLKA